VTAHGDEIAPLHRSPKEPVIDAALDQLPASNGTTLAPKDFMVAWHGNPWPIRDRAVETTFGGLQVSPRELRQLAATPSPALQAPPIWRTHLAQPDDARPAARTSYRLRPPGDLTGTKFG